MRLLKTDTVDLIEVYGADIPTYAILSHTWSREEVLLQDLHKPDVHGSSWAQTADQPQDVIGVKKGHGMNKILHSTSLARQNDYDFIWIDTCCIDKTSSAELSEAINSMYRWYANAHICYAYLADVSPAGTEDPFALNSSFRQSRWFTRGWTLQELIASRQVEFYASDWSHLGSKNGDINFTRLLNEITGVQLDVLTGEMSPQEVSLASRMHWAADRQTTREEDIAYCLLGIFDVTMPLLYGEGKRAFIRLQESILSKEEDQSLFAWHSETLDIEELGQVDTVGQNNKFSGLLADAPDKFWDDSDIEMTMPLTLNSTPPTVTSKGLGIDFFLLPCEDERFSKEADFRVVLNCERTRDGQRESPIIYLKRIWGMGDQFARVRTDIRTFIPPNISLMDDGTDERVFVKQDPSSDIRIIRIMAAKESSRLQLPAGVKNNTYQSTFSWRIKDAWPRQGWIEKSQTFQTQDLAFGLPCGILRLEIKESDKLATLDVAVGMHSPSQRLCRSWCQIMNRESFLDPEGAFAWAMREAQAGNVSFNELSAQDIHGANMSTWIVVNEQNRKRGIDITLHVLSDKSKSIIAESSHDDYSQIIPLSTLSEQELAKIDHAKFSRPPKHLELSRTEGLWRKYRADLNELMEDATVTDSIEISIFPRLSFGSKVRIGSKLGGRLSLDSLSKYCLDTLAPGDTETRRCVQVLYGNTGTETFGFLDVFRILDGRSDSFLQLQPIHWAIIGGNPEIVRTLINSGVEPIGKSDRRLSTLHLAMLHERSDILEVLLNHLYPNNPTNDPDGILFNQNLENLEATINNEDHPLHFAAAYAQSPSFWTSSHFQWLCGRLLNRFGETPLHRAAAMGNLTAVDYMISPEGRFWNGSTEQHIGAVDNKGRTPLWHAACSDNTGEITSKLVAAGSRPEIADQDGLAPIHVSCREGTIGCLKTLIVGGADPSLGAGTLGLLPAHFAILSGNTGCLRALLRVKPWVAIDSIDLDGLQINALHLAIANGQDACARLIWDGFNEKPHFSGWSLCIVNESKGRTIKWMYMQINDEHWFAIDDPSHEDGTRNFICVSGKDAHPALWVSPSLVRDESDHDDDNKEDDDFDDRIQERLADEYSVIARKQGTLDTKRPTSDPPLQYSPTMPPQTTEPEAKGHKWGRNKIWKLIKR